MHQPLMKEEVHYMEKRKDFVAWFVDQMCNELKSYMMN